MNQYEELKTFPEEEKMNAKIVEEASGNDMMLLTKICGAFVLVCLAMVAVRVFVF